MGMELDSFEEERLYNKIGWENRLSNEIQIKLNFAGYYMRRGRTRN